MREEREFWVCIPRAMTRTVHGKITRGFDVTCAGFGFDPNATITQTPWRWLPTLIIVARFPFGARAGRRLSWRPAGAGAGGGHTARLASARGGGGGPEAGGEVG